MTRPQLEEPLAPTATCFEPPRTDTGIRLLFSALVVVMLLAALDQTIVATALPTVAAQLGGIDRLPWVIAAYMLASTVVVPLYGKLSDIYGRKRLLQSGLLLFLLGSALCGAAGDMLQLVLARAIQGLGGGGLLVVSMATISDTVTPAQRGRYQGMFGAVYAVATVAGPLLGGYLIEQLSWRWIFYINLPLGLGACLMIQRLFRAPQTRHGARVDFKGIALLSLTLLSIALFATQGGVTLAWSNRPIWCVLLLAFVSLGGFLYSQTNAVEPTIPLVLFRQGTFAAASLTGLSIGTGLFGSIAFLPLYLQLVIASTPAQAGLQLLPLLVGTVISASISGRIITKIGRYRVFPMAGTCIAAAAMLMLSLVDNASPTWYAPLCLVLLGTGVGMAMHVLILASQNAVDPAHVGVATSSAVMFRSVGGLIGVAAFGGIAAEHLHAPVGGWDTTSFANAAYAAYLAAYGDRLRLVYRLASAVMLIAFACACFIRNIPLRDK